MIILYVQKVFLFSIRKYMFSQIKKQKLEALVQPWKNWHEIIYVHFLAIKIPQNHSFSPSSNDIQPLSYKTHIWTSKWNVSWWKVGITRSNWLIYMKIYTHVIVPFWEGSRIQIVLLTLFTYDYSVSVNRHVFSMSYCKRLLGLLQIYQLMLQDGI